MQNSFEIRYNKNLIRLKPATGNTYKDEHGRLFKKHHSGTYQLIKKEA